MSNDRVAVVCSGCQRRYRVPSNASGTRACRNCGRPITIGKSNGAAPRPAGRRNRAVLIGSIVTAVAVAGISAVLMFLVSPPATESTQPIAVNPAKLLPIVQPVGKHQATEGEEIRITPTVTNLASFEKGLRFSSVSELPTGCVLNEDTGELTWTPSEVQGPKEYNLMLRVMATTPGEDKHDFPVDITVAEVNQPPTFESTLNHSVTAGDLLLVPLSAKDDDFPPNDVTFHMEPGSSIGAVIDSKTQSLRWQVPVDHDQKMVPIQIRVTDSGSPEQSVRVALQVQVTATKTVSASDSAAAVTSPKEDDGVVEFQVALPSPIPRELKEVVATDLGNTTPKLKGALSKSKSWRAALVIPQSLQGRVKTRHTDESFSTFLVDVLGASRDKQRTEQLDGAIARCTVANGKIEWMWEASKSATVRGLQNNLRDCVLELVSNDGKVKLLIGLSTPAEVAFSLEQLFNKDDLQARASRLDRRAQIFPLVGTDLSLEYSGSQAKLTPVDAMAQKNTAAKFESAELAKILGVKRVGLTIRSRNNEYVVALYSEPSLVNRKKTAMASRKIYLGLIGDQRKWNRKLISAKKDLTRALSIPQNSKVNRDARAAGIQEATANGNKAVARLKVIEQKLPVAKRTMDNTKKEFDALSNRFTVIQNARITGEVFTSVANSRIMKMKFVSSVATVPTENAKQQQKQ